MMIQAKELAAMSEQMEQLMTECIHDLRAVSSLEHKPNGWKASAKRVRKKSKELERLGLTFRKLSVKVADEAKKSKRREKKKAEKKSNQ